MVGEHLGCHHGYQVKEEGVNPGSCALGSVPAEMTAVSVSFDSSHTAGRKKNILFYPDIRGQAHGDLPWGKSLCLIPTQEYNTLHSFFFLLPEQ